MTGKRLIEVAFPLKQASIDSVHEKNVRHGHISTLHIWPARRPLAACRAALITTLLPDPGDPVKRKEILEKLAGKLADKYVKKKLPSGKEEIVKTQETVGGILHWGRESGPDIDWFREEIKKAYGGRAPKVLDPFAGGGAIPLEAMRLGCEVTAIDINPVAWFILKCTLEYPQKLTGEKRKLPDFILKDREFMEAFFKAQGLKGAALRTQVGRLFGERDHAPQLSGFDVGDPLLEADLAWHVRAWGRWVLNEARKELGKFYPTYASFEPLADYQRPKDEERGLTLVPLDENGVADIDALNEDLDATYLADKSNPRWVAKPTVAYLWARTVTCKNCRATIPLLKTRWLCKKDRKRIVLEMMPKGDKSGVEFAVQHDVPVVGSNAAARREHDKRVGAGTMSRSGAQCPCCSSIMTSQDLRLEAQAGRAAVQMTAVVVEGHRAKEYRLPTDVEIKSADQASAHLPRVFSDIPFGLPSEAVPLGASRVGGGSAFTVTIYGLDQWKKLFLPRQLIALGTLVRRTREAVESLRAMYPTAWVEAIGAFLACAISRASDYLAAVCVWEHGAEEVKHVFMRWALPITWDIAEGNPLAPIDRFFMGGLASVTGAITRLHASSWQGTLEPKVTKNSAIRKTSEGIDVIVTDPPYYDAIPYSDLMDFFYVWLRRTLNGLSSDLDRAFSPSLGPKWSHEEGDGELIDDASRFQGDSSRSKQNYESGMYKAFVSCWEALNPNGRIVVVFANKNPDAWETMVSAIVRAGFVVDATWPIMTEMRGGLRNLGRASLSSSVWLVCRKRPDTARPGWDNRVLEEMHTNITIRLREFWDAGIRGPDFVWAATGPALEAYSQHPVVKKANSPDELMTVQEFLQHVRRIVVNFVVGRVLLGDGTGEEAAGLDDVTTYYLLHRNDFGFVDAPAGACILYAISCGLRDREVTDQFDLVARTGGKAVEVEEDESANHEGDEESGEGSGSKLKLKAWNQRKGKSLGFDAPRGRPLPLIDQVHRLMYLWKAADVIKVNEYLDDRALRHNRIFHQLLQALIELAPRASEERSILESISNHAASRGVMGQEQMPV